MHVCAICLQNRTYKASSLHLKYKRSDDIESESTKHVTFKLAFNYFTMKVVFDKSILVYGLIALILYFPLQSQRLLCESALFVPSRNCVLPREVKRGVENIHRIMLHLCHSCTWHYFLLKFTINISSSSYMEVRRIYFRDWSLLSHQISSTVTKKRSRLYGRNWYDFS
jgi:hypothetical protein